MQKINIAVSPQNASYRTIHLDNHRIFVHTSTLRRLIQDLRHELKMEKKEMLVSGQRCELVRLLEQLTDEAIQILLREMSSELLTNFMSAEYLPENCSQLETDSPCNLFLRNMSPLAGKMLFEDARILQKQKEIDGSVTFRQRQEDGVNEIFELLRSIAKNHWIEFNSWIKREDDGFRWCYGSAEFFLSIPSATVLATYYEAETIGA